MEAIVGQNTTDVLRALDARIKAKIDKERKRKQEQKELNRQRQRGGINAKR